MKCIIIISANYSKTKIEINLNMKILILFFAKFGKIFKSLQFDIQTIILQTLAQNSDFVDFLLDLQNTTATFHEYMVDVYAAANHKLGIELTELNDEAVNEISKSLRAITKIIDDKDKNIAEIRTPENESCVNVSISGWHDAMRVAGFDVQGCSDCHVEPIYEKTEKFHLFIQDHNFFAYDVQNLVLKTFTDIRTQVESHKIF